MAGDGALDDAALDDAVREALAGGTRLGGAEVTAIVTSLGLPGPEPVALAAVPHAAALADPPISGYRVGVVGLEDGSGDLLLAGNLEFPGADLTRTVHAEGAVATRAFLRGTALTAIALHAARPCAFCRQTLAEFAWAPALRLIDRLGHVRGFEELYPWAFVPGALGVPAAGSSAPGDGAWPDLGLDDDRLPRDVAAALLDAGRHAHAPYSGCPAAVVLRTRDGTLVAGRTLESVAFDPTLGPLQTALVALRAGGHGYADLDAAWLASRSGGAVDDVGPTRQLLAAIAPAVPLVTTTWN